MFNPHQCEGNQLNIIENIYIYKQMYILTNRTHSVCFMIGGEIKSIRSSWLIRTLSPLLFVLGEGGWALNLKTHRSENK